LREGKYSYVEELGTHLETRALLVTTVPGLEDLLLLEVSKLLGSVEAYSTSRGRVIVKSRERLDGVRLHLLLSHLTLAEKLYLLLLEGEAASLEEVLSIIREHASTLEEILRVPMYFAVRARRVGDHPFTSCDLAREVGRGLQMVGVGPPVSLDDPDITFYAELIHNRFRLGVDLTPFISLKDRGYRVYLHPSALNPIVARAMCRVAGIGEGGVLIDPMCGSGTIVIECMLENPSATAVGCDVNPLHVRGARENAVKAGVNAEFLVAEIGELESIFRCCIEAIVTNPPYGVRERAVGGLYRVYRRLFEGALRLLEQGGRLVILTPLKRIVRSVVKGIGELYLESVRNVEIGGLVAYMYKFKRL